MRPHPIFNGMNRILIAILLFTALIRMSGVFYGLPLRLIADEPQFVLGAIEMVQEKTLIPPFYLISRATFIYI